MRLKSYCSPACIIFLSPFAPTAWNFVGSILIYFIFLHTYTSIYLKIILISLCLSYKMITIILQLTLHNIVIF